MPSLRWPSVRRVRGRSVLKRNGRHLPQQAVERCQRRYDSSYCAASAGRGTKLRTRRGLAACTAPPSAAIRASRAAPSAQPNSLPRDLMQRHVEHVGEHVGPVRASASRRRSGRALGDPRAGRGAARRAHRERRRRRLRARPASCAGAVVALSSPSKAAAHGGVVVRRALAGEIGQRTSSDGRPLGTIAERAPADSASSRPRDARPATTGRRGREHHAHLVPGVRHAHGRTRARPRSGRGAKPAVVAHSTPEVPSETKASPGRTAPMPTAPAALSPRAAGERAARAPKPQRRSQLGPQLPGRRAAFDEARHLRSRRARTRRAVRRTSARARHRARACPTRRTCPSTNSPQSLQRSQVLGQQHAWRLRSKIVRLVLAHPEQLGRGEAGHGERCRRSRAGAARARRARRTAGRCGRRSRGCTGRSTSPSRSSSVGAVHLAGEADRAPPPRAPARCCACSVVEHAAGRLPPVCGILLATSPDAARRPTSGALG